MESGPCPGRKKNEKIKKRNPADRRRPGFLPVQEGEGRNHD